MKTNYYQVVDMTKEEKIAMYMGCTKRELIEMLLENQELLMQSIMRDNNFADKGGWPPPYDETTNTGTKFTSSASMETKTLYNLNRGGLRKK
jgi:hypothetical protein